MADIQWTHLMDLQPGWRMIGQNGVHQLAILDTPTPHAADVQRFGDYVVAVLSNDVRAADIVELIGIHRERFVEGLRTRWPAAGIIWNTVTDECCIFRDIWGFVIWGVSRIQNAFECTTSPDIFSRMVHGRPLCDMRIASYLQQTEDDSRADFFDHTERILPGECLILSTHCIRFFEGLLGKTGNSAAEITQKQMHRVSYWANRNYHYFDASYDEVMHELRRQLVKASSRIGQRKDLCFTLSGGLDSSGILSTYSSENPSDCGRKFDAMSLISHAHPSCDESAELDVLEAALPIRLLRVNMDDAWTLSRPELYERYGSWGPMASPGIEPNLLGYEAAAQAFGARTIITGYGGNLIVKVRPESLLRHVLKHGQANEALRTIQSLDSVTIRYLLARTAANSFGGIAYRMYQRLRRHPVSSITNRCMSPWFNAQFCDLQADPVFCMTHVQERAWLPISWDWEYMVRCLDKLARLTPHRFYDPLTDPVLYDFCAQIPPQYFERYGEYRKIYKDALAAFLPDAIIAHPKCQSFDDISHEGLGHQAAAYVQSRIQSCSYPHIRCDGMQEVYRDYLDDTASHHCRMRLGDIWRPLSLCFWKV